MTKIVNKFSEGLKKYKFKSLLVKHFLRVIIFMVIIIIAISYTIYDNAVKTMNKELSYANYVNTQRVRDLGDTIFREVEMIIADAETNGNVQLYMSADEPEEIIGELYSRLREKFSGYPIIYKYIQSIYIYSERGERVFASNNQPIKDFTDTGWLEKYRASQADRTIWARKINNAYPYVITFMKRTSTYKNNGAIVINVNIKELGKLLGSVDNDYQNIFITADDGTILYGKDRTQWFENIREHPLLSQLMQVQDNEKSVISNKNEVYVVNHLHSSHYNWSYSTIGQINSYRENLSSAKTFVTLVILILMFASLCIAAFMAFSTYQPVQSIIEILDKPVKWNVNSRERSSGEVKYIAERIITTIHENDALQKELANRMNLLNNAHIRALQAQLNPHFLGNALNLINLLIVNDLGEEHPSSVMLNLISKLLRFTLEMNDIIITLHKEITYVKMYVDILKERYEDMFEAQWDIDKSILNYKVLKLCLQPLIENAVYHGICPTGQNGIVKISGEVNEERMILSVSDNGVGIPQEVLHRLKNEMNGDTLFESKHVGIKNVHQRIRLMFGEKYGVRIESTEGIGTKITLTLPILS